MSNFEEEEEILEWFKKFESVIKDYSGKGPQPPSREVEPWVKDMFVGPEFSEFSDDEDL